MSSLTQSTALGRLWTRTSLTDPAGFVLLTAAIVGFYVFLRAPVLDPPNYLDPWIYTALFTNYGYLHSAFGWTYYPSRLPWIIPGMVVHAIFGPISAFFVLHSIFFVAGGLFLFLLLRRFFGTAPAFVGYAALMLSPLFYDSYSNDYPDGALLTFLFGALYFVLTTAQGRARKLRLGLAGFFMAAALGTNLFTGVVLLCAALLYAAVNSARGRTWKSLGVDAASAASGAIALIVLCGSVSKHFGGEFLFFMPQWRAISTISSSDYKTAGYAWMLSNPQLIVPLFTAACVIALAGPRKLGQGWRTSVPSRFVAGSVAFTGVLYAVIATWEFALQGDVFETSYYFSLFDVATALCVGSAAYLIIDRWDLSEQVLRVTGVTVVAAGLPILLVYRWDIVPTGRSALWPVVALVVASLALLVSTRHVRAATAAAALVALFAVAFSVSYASAAGKITQSVFRTSKSTYGYRRDTLLAALQLTSFMRAHHLQSSIPAAFWYNPRSAPELNGIQSTYLWGDSWIGLDMPRVTPDAVARLESRKPPYLILLCTSHPCSGAPAVLSAHGYSVRPVAQQLLEAGRVRVWARAFRIPKFPLVVNGDTAFYLAGASALVLPVVKPPLRVWSWAAGAPRGWTGAGLSAAAKARGAAFDTGSSRFGYELIAPTVTVPAGTYRAELAGSVLHGGLDLGVLDAKANSWIAQTTYWSGESGFATKVMATEFSVAKPTAIGLILANWVPHAESSRWRLRDARLVRIGP
jgi:hypothetical protein